jgi:uncharacterized membrane protein
MQGLGHLKYNKSGRTTSQAYDICSDGSKIVGKSYNGNYTEAFYWDSIKGMRSLKSLLSKDFGLKLAGWTLTEARAISDDGSTIVGWGINPHGLEEAWIARLGKN